MNSSLMKLICALAVIFAILSSGCSPEISQEMIDKNRQTILNSSPRDIVLIYDAKDESPKVFLVKKGPPQEKDVRILRGIRPRIDINWEPSGCEFCKSQEVIVKEAPAWVKEADCQAEDAAKKDWVCAMLGPNS